MSTEDYVPLIEALQPIGLAIIAAIQAITIALITVIFKRSKIIKEDAAATKDQIVNHHPEHPNYRDQQDARHAETKRWFIRLEKRIKHVDDRVGKVETLANDLADGWLQNRESIDNIEHTLDMKRKKDK